MASRGRKPRAVLSDRKPRYSILSALEKAKDDLKRKIDAATMADSNSEKRCVCEAVKAFRRYFVIKAKCDDYWAKVLQLKGPDYETDLQAKSRKMIVDFLVDYKFEFLGEGLAEIFGGFKASLINPAYSRCALQGSQTPVRQHNRQASK